MVFDLPVSGDKVKPQQVTALHLFCGLAFVGTGAIISIYNYDIPKWGAAILIAGLLLVFTTLFKNKWLVDRKNNLPVRIGELAIAVAIAILSLIEQWKFPSGIFLVLSAAILFSIYWERAAGQQLHVHIDDKGVHLPVTSRKRFISWSEIEQVLLVYGVLSVDCNDNKLFQEDVSATNINVKEFEAFCRDMVVVNKIEKDKNDW